MDYPKCLLHKHSNLAYYALSLQYEIKKGKTIESFEYRLYGQDDIIHPSLFYGYIPDAVQ